ncbi:MAG: GNAT family N-acetyltransferase [Terriglobales bacterium]
MEKETSLLKTFIARSAAEMDRISPVWERLYTGADATMFQSFEWNRLAAAQFAQREAPYVVCVESDSGAAVVPAAVASDHLTFLGELLFDYRGVLAAGDPEILKYAWATLAALRLPLHMTALRGESSCGLYRGLEPEFFVNAPGVRMTDISAEKFASQHTRLGRYRRRLERQGIHVRRYNGMATSVIASIYGQKAEQFAGPDNIFADVKRIEFITRAAAMQPERCDVFTLESLGATVAGLITFRDGGVRRFYTVYFDPAFARSSPGTVLIYEATRQSLAAGLDCDYMTGEQPHKTRFATHKVPLFKVQASAEALARAAGPWEVVSEPAA